LKRYIVVHTEDPENAAETRIDDNEDELPLTERRDFFNLLEITVNSDPRHIHELVIKLRAYFQDLKIDSETVEDMVLLIDEAVTNTAEHAHEYDPNKKVEVRITIKPAKVQILVKGLLKKELINNQRFTEFLKRLIKERIITSRKAQEFVRELQKQDFLTAEAASSLRGEFYEAAEIPHLENIDELLQDFLDERGRGIILMKHLTEGKIKVDIIGTTLTFVLTKNLRKNNGN
jgi:hypothetical protein